MTDVAAAARGPSEGWLRAAPGDRVSPVLLLAALLVVHEDLVTHLGPVALGEGLYLQGLALAQGVVLAALVALAASVAGRLRPAVVGAGFTLAPLLYVDAAVHTRIDRHLTGVLGMLLNASLDENRRMLDAAGVGAGAVLAFVAGLVAVAALGGALSAWIARRGPRPWLPVPTRGRLLGTALAALAVLAGLEAGAARTVSAASWVAFSRDVPQLLGTLGPAQHAKASFRAALLPPAPESTVTDAIARLEVPDAPPPGDVFFFVVESLRADALDTGTMPALDALSRDSLRFGTAVSGGNVTEYGWYSLFTSQPALSWQADPGPDGGEGAAGLRVARRRGWRVEVLWSGDPGYMRIDEMLLGRGRALADDVLVVGRDPTSAAGDAAILAQLAARIARPHPPTVYVVSLESTHLPYEWAPDFAPPFAPYAPPEHFMRAQTTPAERRAVYARYRNAVAYVDALIGRFVAGLRASGSYDDATLVVAGDHGEEFWEHGVSSHSAEACAIQTHVALLVKPSRAMRASGDWSSPKRLARTIDVWPTLLDASGVRGDLGAVLGGVSLLRGAPSTAVTATQRYRERPARFVVEDRERRAVLEMSEPDRPLDEQRIDVVALLDAEDRPVDDARTPGEYLAAVRERFAGPLGQLFRVRW